MIVTVVVTEVSYRFLETPVRTGEFRGLVERSDRRTPPRTRR